MAKYRELYSQWAKYYNIGKSMYWLAKKYNCSQGTVKCGLKMLGVIFRNKKSPIERYNTFVIKNKNGCWGWIGALDTGGYGVLSIKGRLWHAHRYSHLIHKGNPGDKFVCHTCDNRQCSNPEHLFLGTHQDNLTDCRLKGRHATAKLNETKIVEIKKLISLGETDVAIAKKYQVARSTIYFIRQGRYWSYVNI